MTPIPRRQNTATPSGDNRIPIGAISVKISSEYLMDKKKKGLGATAGSVGGVTDRNVTVINVV